MSMSIFRSFIIERLAYVLGDVLNHREASNGGWHEKVLLGNPMLAGSLPIRMTPVSNIIMVPSRHFT